MEMFYLIARTHTHIDNERVSETGILYKFNKRVKWKSQNCSESICLIKSTNTEEQKKWNHAVVMNRERHY